MDKLNKSNRVIYNDGELELDVSVVGETLWLTQKQIAELFEVTKQNISLHINRIFKDEELDEKSTVKFFLIVQKEGNRAVERNLEHYNLDMIISVGYRVNSITATKFRQWATSILKNYIQNGYVINSIHGLHAFSRIFVRKTNRFGYALEKLATCKPVLSYAKA